MYLLAAGAACGVLIALSVPPFGFWPLAWLGFAGLAFLLPGRSWRARCLLGLGAGLGQYAIGLAWVSEFSIPGCVALMILGALFDLAALSVVPSSRVRSVAVGMPAAFILSDWVRARFPLGGFPLGGTSLGQAVSPLVPSVRLGGSLLLTGETVLAGVALAQAARSALAWRALRSPWAADQHPRELAAKASRGLAWMLVAGVGIPLAGWLSPTGSGGRFPEMRVALVQGGGQRGTRAVHTDPQIVFDRHMAASSGIRTPVDLIVLPEGVLQTSVTFTETDDSAEISALATRTGATVVAGVEQDVGTRHYLNEVAAWAPDGTVVGTYVKNHLVPFGEYVPWRSVIASVFNVSDVPLDAIAGHSPGFMRTPAAPIGLMISYEVFFDERARGGVRSGAQVLVVPTNTASYRSSQVPVQELAAARLRAWETGRWVLQVTPTGYTAVVRPDGSVVARTTLGRRGVIESVVRREDGRTVYVELGDDAVAIVAAVSLVAVALSTRSRWRRGHHDSWSLRRVGVST